MKKALFIFVIILSVSCVNKEKRNAELKASIAQEEYKIQSVISTYRVDSINNETQFGADAIKIDRPPIDSTKLNQLYKELKELNN